MTLIEVKDYGVGVLTSFSRSVGATQSLYSLCNFSRVLFVWRILDSVRIGIVSICRYELLFELRFTFIRADIFVLFLRGNLVVKRQSLLPRVLSVTEGSAVCRKPFKLPCSNGYSGPNEELARRLWARKRFVPWGSSRPALVAITNRLDIPEIAEKDVVEEIVTLPPGVDPLVLWQSEESDVNMIQIAVDPLLVRFLRPHQRYVQIWSLNFVLFYYRHMSFSRNLFLFLSLEIHTSMPFCDM